MPPSRLALAYVYLAYTSQGYVAKSPPGEWKDLFRDATNVAFMVKYAAYHPSPPAPPPPPPAPHN